MPFRKSRALWDRCRRPDLASSARWAHTLRAVGYELQPVRFQGSEQAWMKSLIRNTDTVATAVWWMLSQGLPGAARSIMAMFQKSTWSQWRLAVGVGLYYLLLRWIHSVLHAGPFVLILSTIVAIFTVGVGDTATDGLSAYAVFNRGFQRLLGSVDTNALLAQHVGGGMMNVAGLVAPGDEPMHVRGEEPLGLLHVEENQRGDNDLRDPHRDNGERQDEGNDRNRSRLSNKKARRRRNQEQHREMRRQRDAAQAMGFGTGEEGEEAAMIRLAIEED